MTQVESIIKYNKASFPPKTKMLLHTGILHRVVTLELKPNGHTWRNKRFKRRSFKFLPGCSHGNGRFNSRARAYTRSKDRRTFFYWKPTKENKKSPKNGFIMINSNTKIYYFKRRSNILKEWQGTHSQFQFDPSLRASEERNMKQPQPWQITAVNVRYVPH